ncbi:neurobeachin-like protein 1 isoform X2 [Toxorhynchites rutilus septentrionalis]|uniref:neurobeachin-like protein 1 isoform X2 n=1 Tax=Toxorhynchites rutilus septentrionalis TaxID=329112 RepID=UPI0024796DBC|nr:neurobeachin-like protein 1 isoform X2 [Toxorhynchites rutilus septentrionalis]
MDSKKDIYNLWVQYTTKNEEKYFRQFIQGFVGIWRNQLVLDFENPPHWSTITSDSGPHLNRLPDELLPAIEKFLIIARDKFEKVLNDDTDDEAVEDMVTEIRLLVQCLTIICRHFDNIVTIIKSSYISSCVAISNVIIDKLSNKKYLTSNQSQFITCFSNLLEALYDPYLTWRNFLRGEVADYSKLVYKIPPLHAEIVPFIYDCFQTKQAHKYPEIGKDFIHILGAVISGSQHNGLRAISPATVNVVVDIISQWESDSSLRKLVLQCFTLMTITLQKSSPEQRQIDLLTMFQLYMGAVHTLLDTKHFLKEKPPEDSFELTHNEDDNYIDINALNAIIGTIEHFLPDHVNKQILCNAIFEAKFLPILVQIPESVKSWNIEQQSLASTVVRSLRKLCSSSEKIHYNLIYTNTINILFRGLKSLGRPSHGLICDCLYFAFDESDNHNLNAQIVSKLIEWIPTMGDQEQIYLSDELLKKCSTGLQSKHLICEQRMIKNIVDNCLDDSSRLSVKCILHLLSLIEELAKHSIHPTELKCLFRLLRVEVNFEYSKHLIDLILRVSQYRLSLGVTPKEYFDIQNNTNGITIPDIRKWDTTHGFVFHVWVRLDKDVEQLNADDELNLQNYRRHLFSLTTTFGTGYEFFIQKNGNFVVSVITKKDFFTATAQSTHLLDGRWHSITVNVIPPKRLFSYHQINVYIDSVQKMGSTMKYPAFAELFHYCAIGAPYNNVRKATHTSHQSNTARMSSSADSSPTFVDKVEKPRGLFPSLMEKSFFPGIVSQVPSYFTLPARQSSPSSLDPSVKSYPIGMQDLVFGDAICLKGQLGSILLADAHINLKSLFEAGPNVANVLATDMIESFDMASKFVFCFSPSACYDGLCLDLAPGNQYNGHVAASASSVLSIQNAINGVGGIMALLPVLDNISQKSIPNISPSEELISLTPTASPMKEEHFSDWEMLQTNSLTESKIIQNPIACFICLMRNFIHANDLNKDNILKNEGIPIISQLLQTCNETYFDVNLLMAVQLLLESVQNEMPSANMELLHVLYKDLVFNFRIWSKAQFQIVIGHVQYISTIIKDDRKYFRKYFGTQYLLDVIQEFFAGTCTLPAHDAKTVRDSLLRIIRYYIQKEVNIKEISALLTFLTTIKIEPVVVEIIDMLTSLIESKHVKDQIFLLMYEPNMAEGLYTLFMDRHFGSDLHIRLLKFIGGMLNTKRISSKHKAALRLYESTIECNSLYPGLFSFMIPFDLEPEVILGLLDLNLCLDTEMGYAGALCLIYHTNLTSLPLKLEIAKRLMTSTFTKPKAAQMIAKQVGWQESIARLLTKKPVENRSLSDKEKEKGCILTDIEEIVKRESESSVEGSQNADLIIFDDETMELKTRETPNQLNSFMTEAATVIEHEFKELADSVQEAVVDNITSSITSVYSAIRQKTSDIQDTLESLTLSFDEPSVRKKNSLSFSSSSDENASFEESIAIHTMKDDTQSAKSMDDLNGPDAGRQAENLSYVEDNDEENLVYLVSNILFTILWRGVEHSNDSWKERGQVMACINLIALNNELYCSHLNLRLRILEMGVQAALIDLGENAQLAVTHQQNAAQLLRLAYDLVVLDPNEDDNKKCSTKLLDGVLSLLDILVVFQQSSMDDWSEMSHLCLGLLLKCSHNSNSGIVAMATAKLHALLQNRQNQDPTEIGYLLYSLNQAIGNAIRVENSEQYSFLIPVLKALLEKSRVVIGLASSVPELPDTSSGPIFFQNFQTYCTSKQWTSFIDKKIKPLYVSYQKVLSDSLWEPLNTFWAECYESCKLSSQRRARLQMESRRKFQEKILIPCRIRQSEELARINVQQIQRKAKDAYTERRWNILKRFLYGPKGAWAKLSNEAQYWCLSHHENAVRMRLKLEPNWHHDPHIAASNMRDNTTSSTSQSRRLSTELGPTIAPAVVGGENVDDDILQLEEEMRNSIEPQVPETSGKEKIVISQECELITLMSRVKGRLDLTTNQIIFSEIGAIRDDGQRNDFKFPLNQLKELHLRKFNLRRSALEMFLVDQTSYFLNFTTRTRNKIFTKILSLQPPNIQYGSGRSPAELLRSSGLTQKWVNREISNFEYLMHLNTIAGRSYNDLSQYPVFPWILADYISDILDLNDPKSFRDLSKPIGVANPKNEAEVRHKFENFEDPSGMIPKFHYGTHYSNSAGVLHYLIRVEPFTSLHIDLQSGRFDVADRQFHSIPQTWKLLMDNPNDVKELIPEFFYFPEFLKNMNDFDLGILQTTKERVNDVVLPAWAKSAEDFIAIHRRALESEHVSQNLHNWIDLIFGYKQKGPKAIEALNVFYYCSYEGAVDLDKITNPVEREAVEGMINNFGQTPSQLLREAHPKRLSQEELTIKLLKLELKKPDLTLILDRVNSINCELSNEKDPVVYLSTPRSPPRSFLQTSPDMLISVTKSGILGCHSWMSFDKEKGFLLETDATTSNLKNRKKLIGPFHPSINLNSKLFAVSIDGKYLYAGGVWDNSVRIFNMARGKVVASAIHHFDIVTCVALDSCGSFLVTGSKDCTCVIWSINNGNSSAVGGSIPNFQPNTAALNQNLAGNVVGSANVIHLTNNLTPKPVHTLYGHDAAVSCVSIMTELDIVVSGSLDGTVNVYSVKEGQFIRTLNPVGCTGANIEISFVALSYQGHIAFAALDDTSHSVHVFSINGVNLGSKYVSGRVTGLTTATDYMIVSDDAGDLTMSRLSGLKPIFDIPLHIPTQTIVATAGNTHLLAPLRDGSLAVIGIMQPIAYKKHSVLIV